MHDSKKVRDAIMAEAEVCGLMVRQISQLAIENSDERHMLDVLESSAAEQVAKLVLLGRVAEALEDEGLDRHMAHITETYHGMHQKIDRMRSLAWQ